MLTQQSTVRMVDKQWIEVWRQFIEFGSCCLTFHRKLIRLLAYNALCGNLPVSLVPILTCFCGSIVPDATALLADSLWKQDRQRRAVD